MKRAASPATRVLVAVLFLTGCTQRPAATSSPEPTSTPGPTPTAVGSTASAPASPAASIGLGTRPWSIWQGSTWFVVQAGTANGRAIGPGEIPADADSGTLLTVSTDPASSTSTLRTRDLSSGGMTWRYQVEGLVDHASLLGDQVLFASSGGDDGIWSIRPGSQEAERVVDPTHQKGDEWSGWARMISSTNHQLVAAEFATDPDHGDVTILGTDGSRHVFNLPPESHLALLTDGLVVVESGDELVGLSPRDADKLWAVALPGGNLGQYATSDGRFVVVGRFADDHSGDLQLLKIRSSTGEVSTLRTWAAGGSQPYFWPDASTDQSALLASDYEDPSEWAGSGDQAIHGVSVDIADGTERDVTVDLELGDANP